MGENIEKASSGGDMFIWIVTFSILIVIVGYLAYMSKDSYDN
jgi:hypothetical protein